MASRTVALDEESYDLLAREKRSGETFSDAVKRLASRKGSILDFWGMWKEMSESEVAEVRAIRSAGRKRDRERIAHVLE